MPVVVVTGARQTGKTTLARRLTGLEGRRYFTLDQIDVLDQARRDPDSLLGEIPVTLDEVQREPKLLLAVKRRVDAERVPGAILLTGSANLALMKSVSETLAGRAAYLELPPFCSAEWRNHHAAQLIARWFEPKFEARNWPASPHGWAEPLLYGGYPPVQALKDAESRHLWFSGYTQTYLERDLRNLSEVSHLVDFQRLMRMAALRVGRLLNESELARDAGLPQPTCHRYLNLLETGYQIVRLTNYTRNSATGLIKGRKLMWTDSGLGAWLAGIRNEETLRHRPDAGFWLEQSVFQVLQSWKSLAPDRRIYFWRSKAKAEVDFILEEHGARVACEIKSAATIATADLRGLRSFQHEFARKHQPVRAFLLHGGKEARPLGQDLWGLPFGSLF